MSNRVHFVIDGPPQAWRRPSERVYKGKVIRVPDKRDVKYQKMIGQLAKIAMKHRAPWTGPVMVSMVAVFAIPPSWPKHLREMAIQGLVPRVADPDLDNLFKNVGDGCRKIVFCDDNQIVGFTTPFAKRYGYPERTEVTFHLLDQPEAAVTPGQRRLEKNQDAVAQSIIATKKPT